MPVVLSEKNILAVRNGTIRARITRDGLEFLDRVKLPINKEVMITILGVPVSRSTAAFRRSAGAWRGTVKADSLIRNIYNDRLVTTRAKPRL